MVRKILQIGDDTLYKTSKHVQDVLSRESQSLANDLVDTCVSRNGGTVGLSAVQVGVLQSVFVFDINASKKGEPQDFVAVFNPEIEYLGQKTSVRWEGCMSIGSGKNRIYGPVERSERIRIKYTDIKGNRVEQEYKGFAARVIQHEYDHLQGRLFISYVSDPRNLWKSSDLDDYIEENDEYPPIY